MDTKVLRQKYIDMLTVVATTGIASHENDRFQDQLMLFQSSPIYRLRQSVDTIHWLIMLQEQENLTILEYRWLRDTWLY